MPSPSSDRSTSLISCPTTGRVANSANARRTGAPASRSSLIQIALAAGGRDTMARPKRGARPGTPFDAPVMAMGCSPASPISSPRSRAATSAVVGMAGSGGATASCGSTTTPTSATTTSPAATIVVTTSTPAASGRLEVAAGGPRVPSASSGTTRSQVDFSSSLVKQARTVSMSQPPRVRSSTVMPSGTSRTRGIKSMLARTRSSAAARFSRSFGVSEARFA